MLHVAAGGGRLGDTVGYWPSIFPYILLMSLGMGATFVPMTLCAVHGVGARDSGIGSGVLNTMQQVGGALGLATLSTIAVHGTQSHAATLTAGVHQATAGGQGGSSGAHAAIGQLIGQGAFTSGATQAFLTGAFMIWVASAIVWIFLNVKHEHLATDDNPVEVVPAV